MYNVMGFEKIVNYSSYNINTKQKNSYINQSVNLMSLELLINFFLIYMKCEMRNVL